MLRLNRTTEYALIALRHIRQKQLTSPVEPTSAREIADTYGLPFEITAKTLQRLKEIGMIQSTQGARGGYTLSQTLATVNLAQFIESLEGSTAIVTCAEDKKDGCEYQPRCDIQHLMNGLNARVYHFLAQIHLGDFLEKPSGGSHVAQP